MTASIRKCRFLAVCAAATLAFGSSVQAAEDCSAALTANRWQPLLALTGGTGGAAAVAFLDQTLSIQQRALRHPQLAPQVAELQDKVYKSLRSFDLSGLYDMLPDRQHAPWHAITLSGMPAGTGYAVNDVPFESFAGTPSPYGALLAQFEMQPVAHTDGPFGDRYEIRGQAKMNTGILRWPAVLEALRLGLEHTSRPAPIQVPQATLQAVQKTSAYLSDHDTGVLAQFAAAFPELFAWFSTFGHVADLSLTSDSATAGPYHLYVAIQLDNSRLKSRYKSVADYLDRLGDFMTGTFNVSSADGRWLNAQLDTAKQRLALDLWVENGRPVPSRNGQPNRASIGAKISATLNWQTYTNLRFKALGVNVTLRNWRGDWVYQARPDGMAIDGHFNTPPAVEVSGKAFNIFPTKLTEALLPVNVADAVNGFMQVLSHSNGGAGAELRTTLQAPASGDSQTTVQASGTALDNIFVRLGMAMVSHRVLPDGKQAQGLRRILGDGLDAYGKDLARMAKLTAGNAVLAVPAACATRPQ
ncbi:MAG: hypothetical protein EPN72_06010 [Nevskiaceae bacterium]|nr:MAG: hypothetical protein EPN63_03185 [Nevskiaceae bacterium]TBR73687.1 MAG: hypothetical protein EPN72_06010 [Nevskiaceae bacterium]